MNVPKQDVSFADGGVTYQSEFCHLVEGLPCFGLALHRLLYEKKKEIRCEFRMIVNINSRNLKPCLNSMQFYFHYLLVY